MKKALSLVLTLCMLLSVFAAFSSISFAADTDPVGTPISTVEEFMDMDLGGNYYLTQDLDFTGVVPTNGKWLLNKVVSGSFAGFYGTLDGKGYSLKNISITADGDASIFGCWFYGTVKNLTIGSSTAPCSFKGTGSVAALISTGYPNGTATFENVTVYANVTNENGRAAGYVCYGYQSPYAFINCKMYGTVNGKNETAGFIADTGNANTVTFIDCVNYSKVTATNGNAAGFYAHGGDKAQTATFTGCVNYGDVTALALSAGGFYTVNGGGESHMTFTGCANYGKIEAADWRAGGIVGQYSTNGASTLVIDHCYNVGDVFLNKTTGEGYAAGILGGASCNATVTNVYNAGKVTVAEGAEAKIWPMELDGAPGTLTNAFYTNTEAVNITRNNPTQTNVKCVAVADLVTELEVAPAPDALYKYVAPAEGETYPTLVKLPGFSAGSIIETAENAYTIASPDFSAFISYRDAATENHSDLRLVLATDIAGLGNYTALNMTVVFMNGSEAVWNRTWDVAKDLNVYASATGAGNTYTAADGDALFGVIVTGVPNDAWTKVVVTIYDQNGNMVARGQQTSDILGA